MSKNELIKQDELLISKDLDIKTMIYEIRGQKVMLDSDLARLYGYTVKAFNQQVKNNIERFPGDFMWKLSKEECDEFLRSKILTSKTKTNGRGGRTYLPYVFTEQGIYALSGILKGPLAAAVFINLIRAFKQLKDFYNTNSYLLDKVIDIEVKQIGYKEETDNKFNLVFNYINKHKEVKEKVFYKGQIYDTYSLLIDLIKKAAKSIVLIDNYIDKATIDLFKYKKTNVDALIYTSNSKLNDVDINKFNDQYSSLNIKKTNKFHDRFLILDNKIIYLIGASLKDAGLKGFAIVELDSKNIKRIMKEIN